MAHRHLMAVCVVCLLCAEHFPCKAHVLAAAANEPDIFNSDLQKTKEFQDYPSSGNDVPQNYLYDKRKDKLKSPPVSHHQIKKRHAHHHHHDDDHSHKQINTLTKKVPKVTRNYVEKIFKTFSDNSETMNEQGFMDMTASLNLNNLWKGPKDACESQESFLEKLTQHDHHNHDHHEDDHHHEIEVTTDNFLSMCPILLYYATAKNASCLESSNFNLSDLDLPEEITKIAFEDESATVWLYSTLAIFLVSLCGLLGIAVIPIMDMHIYHHALQFLVALAVGTLAGDALLHLMPHAMEQLHDGQDMHQTMMYRGLAAMSAIVFFYFFERFLVMLTEWKQRRDKRDKPSSRVRVMRDQDTASLNGSATTCKHKYSNYPYCYDEIALETKDDHHEHQHINSDDAALNHTLIQNDLIGTKKINGMVNDISNDMDNNTLTLSTSLDDGSIESNALCNNNKFQSGNPVSITPAAKSKSNEAIHEENYTIILREHQSKHHGHSHTHGHVHSPPESLSAVVWMIIMGDGLHNFTDGMAIGAAFSNSIAGGFSTAVAVFCHELPHEIGDFAVLLKAGMSAKKAIFYNIVSSILGFFGMCFGVIMGDTPEASQWMFAVTAGLFLYIAFVDMMPELTSSHGKEESCMISQCFLQFIGMSTGILLMFLIATYEKDLETMFTSTST